MRALGWVSPSPAEADPGPGQSPDLSCFILLCLQSPTGGLMRGAGRPCQLHGLGGQETRREEDSMGEGQAGG